MNNSNSQNTEKISIIIPAYNAEKTIIKTLESLNRQTCLNFIAIIINDGSIDNTDKVVKDYLKKCKFKYNYIAQENAGVSVARNVGLEKSNNPYVMFLDADDVYHSRCIELVLENIENNDVNTVFFSYSRNIESLLKSNIQKEFQKEELNFNEMMEAFMYRKGNCAFFTYVYKRSIIDDYKIRFTVGARYGEDLEFTWKYLSHCKSCLRYHLQLYGYYNNPDSAVNNVNWAITDALESVKRVENYFGNHNSKFKDKFNSYMYARTMWAIVKDFSIFKKKELFEKIIIEYDVSKQMRKLIFSKDSHVNPIIRISAIIFNISPRLFYFSFRVSSF